ncbi:butyrophilin-like protein 2 isoform X2 [Melanotaenia boesemani]|uniref:butyrophilin-like protein 2 isoform X2 n=1 Tax=Melanotaenia boesemani TaxID=1250792 RepID=UPI001C04CEC9|nr:butyrophilin-like protein 2 isoform X2 [Melanotaenia boesemani]
MMMFKLLFWTGCYSLLSVTEQVTAETGIFCSSEPVESICNSSIVLQCHLEPQQDATDNTVKWTQQSDVVHIHKGGKDIPGEQMETFEGRTSLFSEGLRKGNLSLQLSSLKLSDSGRYKCSFQDDSEEKSCYVNLSVSEFEVIGSPEPVTAESGQDVVLPCHLDPPFDATTQNIAVEWRWNNSMVHKHRSQADNNDAQDLRFKGRTSLFHDKMTNGNISLKLHNVTQEDEGKYTCAVNCNGRLQMGNITLKFELKEENSNQTGEYKVIGSSEPVTAESGQDVVLPCHLDPPFDVTSLTVEWRWNNDKVHVYQNLGDDNEDQDQRFKNRTSLFHDEMIHGNISLKLRNVSEEDAGIYTCFVPKLNSQVKKGNIVLKVVLKDEDPNKKGLVIGLSVGLPVGAAILIAGLVYYKLRRRCRSDPVPNQDGSCAGQNSPQADPQADPEPHEEVEMLPPEVHGAQDGQSEQQDDNQEEEPLNDPNQDNI